MASAGRWSNLPVNLVPRNGLALGASGYATFEAVRKADDFLAAHRAG
jgi:hypothetical protein